MNKNSLKSLKEQTEDKTFDNFKLLLRHKVCNDCLKYYTLKLISKDGFNYNKFFKTPEPKQRNQIKYKTHNIIDFDFLSDKYRKTLNFCQTIRSTNNITSIVCGCECGNAYLYEYNTKKLFGRD